MTRLTQVIVLITILIGLFICSQLARAGTMQEWEVISNKYAGNPTITKPMVMNGQPIGFIILIFKKGATPTDTPIAADVRSLQNVPIYFFEKKNGKMVKVWERPKFPKGKEIEANKL